MPDTAERWGTTRFVDPDDLRHDAHVNIVTFQPGGTIPFEETHVMEHGLYVLEGKAVYKLNQDWVEVEAGDFMWLRAYCPQACYAAGPGPFRYLLYKDVNRHARLRGPGAFGLGAGTVPPGRAGISVFAAEPRRLPYRFDLIERHPDGSQAFLPMTQHPFLVIVATGPGARPQAFLTSGAQGINLHRGVWHGVLTPLHAPGLFAVVDRIGTTANLEEYRYDAEWTVLDPAAGPG
jgi:quercetin dioxygenase-like cupin family protein